MLARFDKVAKGLCVLCFMAVLFSGAGAWGQAAGGVPPEIASRLRASGPVLDVAQALKICVPLQKAAPKGGVKRTNDIAYGPAERNRLDVYEPAVRPAVPMPVLVFIHGGAFVAGNKSTPGSPFYDNIGYYFARYGVLTINATYRLAPNDKWPADAVDVGAIVRWAGENAGHYGADSGRIFLMGHSAGATHSAAYASMKGLQPQEGAGLASVILVSGIYDPAVEESMPVAFLGGVPGSPNRAYYGADKKLYQERAILSNLTGAPVRTMIVYAELDMLTMQVEAGAMYTALCRRDGRCPELLWLRDHDHMSEVFAINTADESLARPVLDFIKGR